MCAYPKNKNTLIANIVAIFLSGYVWRTTKITWSVERFTIPHNKSEKAKYIGNRSEKSQLARFLELMRHTLIITDMQEIKEIRIVTSPV